MNTNLLHAINALITDDVESSSEYIRQVLVQKLRTKMGLNEASDDCIEQLNTFLNDSGKKKEFLAAIVDIFNDEYSRELEELSDDLDKDDADDVEMNLDNIQDNTLWDETFTSLASYVQDAIADENTKLSDEITSCVAKAPTVKLQEIIKSFETDVNKLYLKTPSAKLHRETIDYLQSTLDELQNDDD